jgi:signal transduction histidine kinase
VKVLNSLRVKLLLSYVGIVVLSLFLAGSAAVFLFNRYQERVAYRDMRLIAATVAARVPALLQRGITLPEATRRLRESGQFLSARLLILDPTGRVVVDTSPDDELKGERLFVPPAASEPRPPARLPILRHQTADGEEFIYVVTELPPPPNAPEGRFRPRYVALARPLREVQGAWRELAPSLMAVGLVALAVALLIAVMLSGSITRPIAAMTQASEAMARGDYDQTIQVESDDEIGRLGRAFNTMAREVKRAHRMQRDFVANVSHDLKTPLTSIQGFAQALIDGTIKDEEGRRHAAQVIYEETERMGRLVRGLLDLARLESGQVTMAREQVDLRGLLRDCADAFTLRADQAGIRFTARIPDDLPTVVGDAARLDQAFTNLLDNAFKYTPAGGSVELNALPTAEGTIEVSITDTGKGIPPEDLPRVFERFYRADKARSADGSTGLGLAIAHEIIQAHGGTIRVASQVGHGTRFTVTLPQSP